MRFEKGISDQALQRLATISKLSQYSVTKDTFTFDELQGRAQDKALSWFAEAESQDAYWSEDVIENAKLDAPAGFRVEEVLYSGFWSQGDGASWKGRVDLEKYCEANSLIEIMPLIDQDAIENTASVTQSGRYVHDNTMQVEVYSHPGYAEGVASDEVDRIASDLQDVLLSEVRDYAKEIYRKLEEAYNYYTGPEALKESAEANGWRFYQDGEFAGSFDDPNAPDPRQTSIDFSK